LAGRPERDFAEARSRLDRGEHLGVLRSLDRARKGFAGQRDLEGLEHVLDLARLVPVEDDARVAAARANLVYAVKQNVRQATRRAALAEGRPWTDPYPDLESPSEHTRVLLTRGVKIWIGVGVPVATALIVAYFVAIALFVSTATLPVVVSDDLEVPVQVRWCDDASCGEVFETHDLHPTGYTEFEMDADDDLDVVVIRSTSGRRLGCIPIRVHDAYRRRKAFDSGAVKVTASQMTPCPGTAIVPVEY
jgi:hypothetical protein